MRKFRSRWWYSPDPALQAQLREILYPRQRITEADERYGISIRYIRSGPPPGVRYDVEGEVLDLNDSNPHVHRFGNDR